MGILNRLFKNSNDREVAALGPLVNEVNKKEPEISALSDEKMRQRSDKLKNDISKEFESIETELAQLRAQISQATSKEEKALFKLKLKQRINKVFEPVLAEAFALVREAAKRTIGMRHFDVQIAGGIVLHQGKIAEMATGEGKTLVATLPAYLNALSGRGVHIVTVNDYLAKRDRDWMGPVFEFFGFSVGVIQHDLSPENRRRAYGCDITYGTNNEFGFDYLRDNMVVNIRDVVQRHFFFAVVDEVDSILIDEARTPLIISGSSEESTEKYYQINKIVPRLKGRVVTEREELIAKQEGKDISEGFDYIVDEKIHTVSLTEQGVAACEKLLAIENIYDDIEGMWVHHITCALKAHRLFKRDVHYVLKDGKVVIVDEFTGRLMPGRRWSDGLHQAVEAKEAVRIEQENQTLASITFQNYFRMYEKLSGMTGTAMTEALEFGEIYGLDVIAVPTNRPLERVNHPDSVFRSLEEKFEAVVKEIQEHYKNKRPILVGTISIEKSELLSQMLTQKGVKHQVLNAKYHEFEAQIIAQAGRLSSVTIATNMAGRGTDILLGGNPEYMARAVLSDKAFNDNQEYLTEYKKVFAEHKGKTDKEHDQVVALGGLHVIGTERHEARRIDNQLRGRSGRQGDPGSSRFYVSFQDDFIRLFGSGRAEKVISMMDKLGLEHGQSVEHPWITGVIAFAQKRVETSNFEIRKHVLEYDNTMNRQREIIYQQRRMVLEGKAIRDEYFSMIRDIVIETLSFHLGEHRQQSTDTTALETWFKSKFSIPIQLDEAKLLSEPIDAMADELCKDIYAAYEKRRQQFGEEALSYLERMVLLQVIDTKWKDHLLSMDSLKEGIGLRAYGQRNPVIEYQREAFDLFASMIEQIKHDAVEFIFKVQTPARERIKGVFNSIPQELVHDQVSALDSSPSQVAAPEPAGPKAVQPAVNTDKVGRNDPCPCGAIDPATGKPMKFKKCHGR